jgi:hypothetical protein
MEKKGLKLDLSTQKIVAEHAVDSSLLSMVSHNVEQRRIQRLEKCIRVAMEQKYSNSHKSGHYEGLPLYYQWL